jgi:8-oxo-dGTP pyrophosphatase MutT (NUDIX family)
MSLPRRIAAGGLVFRENAVLLVRYPGATAGETFLAAPGGGVEDGEDIFQAVVREVLEETGITVAPLRPIVIEDIVFPRLRMIKIWMLCGMRTGELRRTDGAKSEGILEADWFPPERLEGETVYPQLLREQSWDRLRSDAWRAVILPSRKVEGGYAEP